MFGTQELVIILGIAFFIFGGKKLPEIGSGLGKAITSFKKGLHEVESTGKNLVEEVPGVKEVASLKEEVDKIKDLGQTEKS
jgi:sec-independent protein translocase protein TatA